MEHNETWYDYDEYLRPEHLKGKRVTLEIARAGEVETYVRGGRKVKPVLYFRRTAKYLFLNSTNRRALIALFGEKRESCVGQRVTLGAVHCDNGKEGIAIFPAGERPTKGSDPTGGDGRKADDDYATFELGKWAAERSIPLADVEQALRDTAGDVEKARRMFE